MEEKMMQFVQWLSEKLKVTPGEVVQMLNEAPEEEVKKYTDLFLAETTKETGKFKSGGKINAAVAKFQNGGEVDYHKWLQDIGHSTGGGLLTDEELRLLDNGMRKRYMQETGKNIPLNMKPRSNRLQIAGGDLPLRNGTTEQRSFDRIRVYNGEDKPDTQVDKIYYTNRPNAGSTERRITGSDTTFINNYVNPNTRRSVFTKENPYDEQGNNMWERYQEIWDEYGIKQEGGHITRREALDAFMENKGGTRSQARKALRSAKLSFDNNNMTGDRNQWARSLIARRPNDPQLAEIPVKIPVEMPSEDFKPINAVFNRPTPKMEIQPLTPVKPLKSLPGMDTRRGGTFDQAFAAARKAGVPEFSWNGNRYNTNLSEGRVDVAQKPVIPVTTERITTPSSEESKTTYPILSEPHGFNLTNVNKRWAPAWIKTGEGWPGNYHSGYMVDLTNVDPEIALRTISGIVGVQEHGDIIKQHMTKEQMKKFNTPRPTTMAPYRKLQH